MDVNYEAAEALAARAEALVAADEGLLGDLVARRRELGLTQELVAERMGVSQSAVSQFERYDANPRLSTVRRYALAVGARIVHVVTSDYLEISSQQTRTTIPPLSVSALTVQWGPALVGAR